MGRGPHDGLAGGPLEDTGPAHPLGTVVRESTAVAPRLRGPHGLDVGHTEIEEAQSQKQLQQKPREIMEPGTSCLGPPLVRVAGRRESGDSVIDKNSNNPHLGALMGYQS